MPDIIGVGAVNIDCIVDAGPSVPSDEIERVLDGLLPGSERAVTGAEIEATLGVLEPCNLIASPGGSSLNTLASIAAMKAGVSVGFVGVRGQSIVDELSLSSWFATLDIDDQYVQDSNDLAGVCISHTVGGERSLLSSPGANSSVMEFLAENAGAVISYLGEAKVVLVTSFAGLDDVTPLLEILTEMKRISPSTILCCDPGALWTRPPVPTDVDAVLKLADRLFVNQQEFYSYTKRETHDLDDLDVAGRSLASSVADPAAIVLKRTESIEIYVKRGSELEHESFENPHVLGPSEIVDDTGTGDAFAAGVLLALVRPELASQDGVELGFRLAREKLRWPGLGGLEQYSKIYADFIETAL